MDLTYPDASTPEDEELIKHRLSAQVVSAARMKQFNVMRLDEQSHISVGEIMVGCARVEEIPTAENPQKESDGKQPPVSVLVGAEPHVYGDEDGEQWFATGHLTVGEMITAVRAWEAEVADPIKSSDIVRESHSTYYVIPDPENEERYQLVDHDFPGAEPMTSIRRR